MFVTRMRDVYVVGCLGNAALQADCFYPCYWQAECTAERSKRTLASGLPIHAPLISGAAGTVDHCARKTPVLIGLRKCISRGCCVEREGRSTSVSRADVDTVVMKVARSSLQAAVAV